MKQKERISSKQLFLLVFGQSTAMFIVIAQFISQDAGRDLWLSIFISYVVGIGLGFIIYQLGKQFPDKTIVEYIPLIWGKAVGGIINIAFLLNFILVGLNNVRGPSGNIRAMYPDTPIQLTMVLFGVLACYAIYKGIETFVKVNNFLTIMTILSISVVFLMSFQDINLNRILPILENGFMPVIKGAYGMIAIIINTAYFIGMIWPNVRDQKKALKTVSSGFFCGGVFHALIAIYYLAFYNLEILQQNILYPLFNMMRYIYVARFLFGFEIILMIVWVATSFFLYTNYFLPAILGITAMLKLSDYKAITFPFGAFIIVLANLMPNAVYNINLYILLNKTITIALGVILLLTPLILLIRNPKQNTTKQTA